jgi:hypothetical protein
MVGAALHPPFGNLLPAGGEKVARSAERGAAPPSHFHAPYVRLFTLFTSEPSALDFDAHDIARFQENVPSSAPTPQGVPVQDHVARMQCQARGHDAKSGRQC